ncbi:MAG TPA: ABC transporter ATP-binding protein, partial [Candidatus Saccharibacteria bacterium]|nr:ABC transporter ATP-binding protein [Candidatus Saccharibacteria bacterium]
MVSSKYIVRAKDLTKIYDGKKVVNKINFNVVRGEIFGILGPNGAGKTTTLEMMETIRPIDGGAVIIDGFNVANQQQKIKSIIGVQPQSPAFQDKTKLREIIELFGAAYGRKVNSENLLNQVDLIEKANSYVEDLSGGQKQRLSIAASLVHSPSVFFLDEPTTGLDPQARRHLWNLIESIRRSGVTIIMTTHYM